MDTKKPIVLDVASITDLVETVRRGYDDLCVHLRLSSLFESEATQIKKECVIMALDELQNLAALIDGQLKKEDNNPTIH